MRLPQIYHHTIVARTDPMRYCFGMLLDWRKFRIPDIDHHRSPTLYVAFAICGGIHKNIMSPTDRADVPQLTKAPKYEENTQVQNMANRIIRKRVHDVLLVSILLGTIFTISLYKKIPSKAEGIFMGIIT
jgi:hypothetical protein